MIRVRNGKAISNLARKSLYSNRSRNLVAISAIVLTTLLFTALFTVAGTLVDSFQQQTFRQVGGDMHGTFKNISWEQVEELRDDPMIVSSGARLLVGMPEEAPFNKMHTEISYMDEICAKGYFCMPTHGSLPEENTDEIACDTRVLELLGVEPKLGAKITLPFVVGNDTESSQTVTGAFTLCGWWEFDEAGQAAMAIIPRSYAEQVLSGYQSAGDGDTTGTWDLNIYLKSSAHIEEDLEQILKNHGDQNTDAQSENYVKTGVNWAYLGAQLSSRADPGTIAGIAALLALIALTGYLIIYNIFQISVSNDIRFYGLLKTIGTTGRQLRRIIRRQALTLCIVGIPGGLALGWLVGRSLSPAVLSTLNTYHAAKASANPLIFIGAAAFSLVTVLISCAKPGRAAGRVSPVEAVRWTEGGTAKPVKKLRRSHTVTPWSMALANLSRSKKRTLLVVLSLSLAVVLLELTCTFANGFDMDKYLDKFVVSDYILGSADYFQQCTGAAETLPSEDIQAVQTQDGITDSGCVYGENGGVEEFVSEQRSREHYSAWNDSETVDSLMKSTERNDEGAYANPVNLYGMEDYPLKKLTVLNGSLDALRDPAQNAIVAVLETDDYGKPIEGSNWAKVGDQVKIRYVDEVGYYDIATGEPVDPATTKNGYTQHDLKYHEVTYTVVAVATMRSSMSYRYYGNDQFVLGADTFQKETGIQSPMIYLFDVDQTQNAAMERFLSNYTSQSNPNLDFESKSSYASQFTGTRDMFLLIGGALSAVIGLVGILNFLNAVLTSILSRRREFAILQSVGMTGSQLRKMLIWEGELYAMLAAVFSLALCFASGPLMQNAVGGVLWFFTYRFTITPVLIVLPVFALLGAVLPIVSYRSILRKSVVERLREAE